MQDGTDADRRRRGGRPRLDPSTESSTLSIRLPNPVLDQLIRLAASDNISVAAEARALLLFTLKERDGSA
jgi:hypothetical protein